MKEFIEKSFKREILACFVIVSLLPLVLSTAFLIQMFKVKLERDYRKKDLEQAQVIDEKLTSLFYNFEQAAKRLSQDKKIVSSMGNEGNGDRSAVYERLYEETENLRGAAQFDLYSGDGVCQYSTGFGMFHTQLPDYWGVLKMAADHPDELTIRREKGDASSSNIVLRAAKSIMDKEEKRVGYVVISMRNENFEHVLMTTDRSQDGICILNRFWEPVYSTGTAAKESVGSVLRSRLMEGESVGDSYFNNSIYISSLGNTGLYRVFVCPKVFPSDMTKSMYHVMIVMTIASFLLCAAVAAKMSSHLSLPVRVLNRAMSEVQNGNLDTRVTSMRNDELGQLSGSFNTMIIELKDYMERQVLQQKQLNEVQIAMMQSQLNPHFLYNTLDTIKWVAKANHIPEIATLAAKLAKILRTSISKEQFITLKEEMDLVESYAEIQKIRFQGKIRFDYEIARGLEDCIIPKLIVQPIVENAVIHGLSECEDGHIQVRVSELKRALYIEVEDNGCGISDELMERLNSREDICFSDSTGQSGQGRSSGHIGFYNVDTIIRLYYGASYGLKVSKPKEGGTRVTIVVPSGKERT